MKKKLKEKEEKKIKFFKTFRLQNNFRKEITEEILEKNGETTDV